jgi:WD40 repeat protein
MVRAAIFLFLVLCAGAALADGAKNRVALVIGNSAYKRSALANPVNDARVMAEKLKAQGFDVFVSYDAGHREMRRAVQSFSATLREHGKDVIAFIFYAGHGMQVNGENYLIPVDERIDSEADVDNESVRLSWLMSILKEGKARLAIVVLDACRDNPFAATRGGPRGLAGVDAPRGSLIAFSTSPGKTAPDGPEGGNSYYTAALAQAMTEPGLEIEKVFKKVRSEVDEKTRGEQTPWESTSLTGDFYPAGEKASVPTASAEPLPAKPQQIAAVRPEPQPVQKYEDATQRLVRTFTGHTGDVTSVAISPDGRTALSGSHDKMLKLWDVTSGRELRTFTGHMGDVTSVAFSPDVRTALSGSETLSDRGELKLWDITSGRELRSFTDHTDNVNSVAISPDGRVALSSGCGERKGLFAPCTKGLLKLWDIASGRELRSFTGHTNLVWSVAISADGRTALSSSKDETLKLWDIASGRELHSFKGHTDNVYSVAISPDGRTALSGSCDERDKNLYCTKGLLKLWDIASGRELRSFTGHTNLVWSVAISPNGRAALSASEDHTLKLWDIASGRELRSFTGHTRPVRSVAISPDGRTALSTSSDTTLRLWDISEWTQPQEARR